MVGAKVGQKTSSEVTFPADYGNKDLAGQLTTFEFNVKGIYVEVTSKNITDAMVAEAFGKSYEVSTVAEFMQVMKEAAEGSHITAFIFLPQISLSSSR